MEKELVLAQQYSKLPGFRIGCGTIDILLVPNYRFLWKWVWDRNAKPATDIDVLGNIVWYVTSSEEANKNKLVFLFPLAPQFSLFDFHQSFDSHQFFLTRPQISPQDLRGQVSGYCVYL